MNKHILGLDINDAFLAAVVLRQRGKERQIVAFDSIEWGKGRTLSENLLLLLENIPWKGGACICGISLSEVSIRNLNIPFTDRKKIRQVLTFELEDQLITPVGRQIVEYIHTGQTESASNILVTSIQKDNVKTLLEMIEEAGVRPDVLGLRQLSFAEQFFINNRGAADTIFIDAGLQSIDLLCSRNGEIVFMRHLVYPEQMVTEPPCSFSAGRVRIIDEQAAERGFSFICEDIKKSLDFLFLETGLELSAENIVISGCLGQVDKFCQQVQDEFAIPVISSNVMDDAGIIQDGAQQDEWNPVLHDFALCLALEGTRKKHTLNFLQGEFAPPQLFFAAKGRLLAASVLLVLLFGAWIGYLGVNYHYLNKRYTEMGNRMQSLFMETFPERTRVQDPLIEMQASIQNIQAPSVAIPVFSGNKRTLTILADISERIPPSIDIQVSRMVIDQESVQIKGITNTFNNVNIIQGNLRRSPLFNDVNIISAAADKDSNMIRFELRMETGGD